MAGRQSAWSPRPASARQQGSTLLRVVQDAWFRYLLRLGLTGIRTGEPMPADFTAKADVPFEHPDVRVIIDSMFLDGLLHPLAVQGPAVSIPAWAKAGIVEDPLALRNLIAEGTSRAFTSRCQRWSRPTATGPTCPAGWARCWPGTIPWTRFAPKG